VTALKLLSDARHAIGNVDIASKIDGDDSVVSLTLHFADSHGAARTAHRHGREARSALARSESNAARTAPDFALRINHVPVFCHGTCRTNADPVSRRSSEAQPQHAFEPARDARMNMLRVSSAMAYEADTFYALADEHGRAHLATRRIGEFRLCE
jgi:beta-mannosidase